MAQAAIITQAKGNVSVEREGKILELKQGDSVHTGDIINTQNNAVKITFADGATALLSPQSKLVVQEFSFGGGKEPSFVIKLVEGVMRSVSGELVEHNPDAFKVLTPSATVGIRGTIFITKVNPDGTEVHIVLDLDQGHIVTITDHNGNILSLSAANQAAFIGGEGDDLKMEERVLTEEQLRDLLGKEISEILLDELYGADLEERSSSEVVQDIIEALQERFAADVTEDSLGNTSIILTEGAESSTDEESTGTVEDVPLDDLTLSEESSSSSNSDPTPNGINDYFADGETINTPGTHILLHNTIEITADMQPGVVVSGDVKTITDGIVYAGNDTITGPAMTAGRIVGDAQTVSGNATLFAGADSITLAAKTGGHSVYGDIYEALDSSTIHFNDDHIEITGDFANTVISGDAHIIESGVTVNQWGNDTILINGTMSNNAIIYGDYSNTSAADGGDDSIVVGVMQDSTAIYGGGGSDNIEITTFSGGTVSGGEDNDTITITDSRGTGSINGDGGDDTFTVSGIGSDYATIDGGTGINTLKLTRITSTLDLKNTAYIKNIQKISVDTMNESGAQIKGTDNDDTIIVRDFSAGSIDGALGDDTMIFENAVFGGFVGAAGGGSDTIVLKAGIDQNSTLTLMSSEFELFTDEALTNVFSLDVGTIALGADIAYSIDFNIDGGTIQMFEGVNHSFELMGEFKSGSIEGTAGADNIIITDSSGTGSIYGYAGDDTFTVNGVGQGYATIDGGTGINTVLLGALESTLDLNSIGNGLTNIQKIGVATMNNANAVFNATDGADTITVTTLTLGSVNGNDGADTIEITNFNGGTIDGGEGVDTVTFKNAVMGGAINNTNLTGENDIIKLENGIDADGTLTLMSDWLTLQNANGSLFSLNSGTLAMGFDSSAAAVSNLSFAGINGGTLKAHDNGSTFEGITSFSAGTIQGSDAVDNIAVTSMTGGIIKSGGGADIIAHTEKIVTGHDFAIENSGTGKDLVLLAQGIEVGNVTLSGTGGFELAKQKLGSTPATFTGFDMSGGTIKGSDGVDEIYINSMSGGTINTNGGADTITITTQVKDTVTFDNAGAEKDTIYLAAPNSGINNSGDITLSGSGGFVLANSHTDADGYTGFDMSGGTINGSAGADEIYIDEMVAGKINTNGGVDTVSIATRVAVDITIGNTGAERDELFLGDGLAVGGGIKFVDSGGFVLAKSVDSTTDVYERFIMFGGNITGSAGADSLVVDFRSGSINAGLGNDFIDVTFESFNSNSDFINGGAGADTISFGAAPSVDVTLTNSDSEQDSVFLNKLNFDDSSFSGNSLMLDSSAGGFKLQGDATKGFVLGSTTVNGSAGDDYIWVDDINTDNVPTINGNAGTDTLEITSQLTKRISVENTENIYLTNGVGANAQLSMGSASTVTKNSSSDGFDMSGGTLTTNDHNSTFVIGSFSGGVIDCGEGENIIKFKNAITGGKITNSGRLDELYIEKGIQAGSTLELSGNDFSLLKAQGAAFSLDSGTLKFSGGNTFTLGGGINGGTLQYGANLTELDIDNFKAGTIESYASSVDLVKLQVEVASTNQHAAEIILNSGTGEELLLSAPTSGGDVFVDIRGFDFNSDAFAKDGGEAYVNSSDEFDLLNGAGTKSTIENAVTNGSTIKINDVWVTFVGVKGEGKFHVNPDESFFGDSTPSTGPGAETPGVATTYVDDFITSDGLNASNDEIRVISGDVGNLTPSNGIIVSGGYDTIEASSVASGFFGIITGDALDLSGNFTFKAGNDHITVNSLSGDKAVIYGDAREVGDDADTITFYGGNDTIIVANMTEGAKIYGDTNDSDVGSGNDVIFVTYMFSSNQDSSIYGGGGNDDIDVTNMESSNNTVNIFGGSGSDSIDVTYMMTNSNKSKAEIYGEAGNDSITVANMQSSDDVESHIYGGLGGDTISVTATFTGNKSFIYGNEGNDSISVLLTNTTTTKDESPTIDVGDGRDTISIGVPGSGASGEYYVHVKGDLDDSDKLVIVGGDSYTGQELVTISEKESHTFNVNSHSITVYFS